MSEQEASFMIDEDSVACKLECATTFPIQSNGVIKLRRLPVVIGEEISDFVLIAKAYSIECYELYDEERHLSRIASIGMEKHIVDVIIDVPTSSVFVLCSDGSVMVTIFAHKEEDGSFSFSSWKEITVGDQKSRCPVKLLHFNNSITVVYLEDEILFINPATHHLIMYEYMGIHLASCSIGSTLYLYLDSRELYTLVFDDEFNLVHSNASHPQHDILSLHMMNEKVAYVTTDSSIVIEEDKKTTRQVLVQTGNQYISEISFLDDVIYACTESGDIYSILKDEQQEYTTVNLYSKLGIDQFCLLNNNQTMLGYSPSGEVLYIPLSPDMSDEEPQPTVLLSNVSNIIDFDLRDDNFVVASSGSLSEVRDGISCKITSLTDESSQGINRIFTLSSSNGEYIILSFFNQTKVLKVLEDSIEDFNQEIFDVNHPTIFADKISESHLVQITHNEIRIMDNEMSRLILSHQSNKSIAITCQNSIYLSVENKLVCLQFVNDQLNEVFNMALENDVSCIYATDGVTIASTYAGNVHFLSGNSITKTLDINEYCTDTNIVESIYSNTDEQLILGLRDGHALFFNKYIFVKRIKLGNVPVQLKEYDSRSLVAVSNDVYFMELKENVTVTNINIKEQLLCIQKFDVTGFENSMLCLTSDCKVKILNIERDNHQPNVKVLSPHDYQRVCTCEDRSMLCVSKGYRNLELVNSNNQVTTLYQSSGEKIYSVLEIKNHDEESLSANQTKNILVGTQTVKAASIIMNQDPSSGSLGYLHLLKYSDIKGSVSCEHVASVELPFIVYSIAQFDKTRILAGCGNRLILFTLNDSEISITDQAVVRHFVSSISVYGNLIAITDRKDGLLFFTIIEGKLTFLRNTSLHLEPLSSATCQFINQQNIITIDRNNQLIIWGISQNINTPSQISAVKKLKHVTRELALKVKVLSNTKCAYVTISGTICYLDFNLEK